MTAPLVLHGIGPVLLATSLVWKAGLAPGGRWGLGLGSLQALALSVGLAGFSGAMARLAVPALSGREWLWETPIAVAVAVWALRTSEVGRLREVPGPRGWALAVGILLAACLAVSLGAAVLAIAQHLSFYAHGTGADSYGIWNLKARFLYRGGVRVWRLFDPLIMHSHPRYPLLLPGLVSRLWSALGHETTLVPRGLALAFFGLVPSLLVATLAALRGWIIGCLAGLGLLCLPFFVENAWTQGADLPFSLFAVAALGCLALAMEDPRGGRGALVLAGVFAGLAAWTKQEGLVLVLASLGGVALGSRPVLRLGIKRAAFVLAGSLPLLAALFWVEAAYVKYRPEYMHGGGGLLAEKALSLERHGQIWAAALRFVSGPRQWPALTLLALVALAGLAARRGASPAQRPLLAALGVVAAGYYAAYLATPYPLAWQLSTSVDRLFIQYWPSLVLLAFIGVPRDE
jgi:dolichyl-phosphate-mannose-protein mannosyltransferase